ncbi:hypothetical protein OEA41_008578 [Lepraria neglecta]|uniref:Uncharacterized protein n=1 Tax=Lepraria neglecta TaxID=209136 RepID=A0AAD9ZIB1_9LECA|nr:hypothetical protein OEA41_008578 [Lepraria neglecta]
MSVAVLANNYLHRKCGIAYPKAYNLIKHLFDTPLKKHRPFQNPHFEALGFSQSNLDRWYEANHKGSSSARRRKHEQLVRQYNTTKIRLQAALKSAEDTTYRPPRPQRRNQGVAPSPPPDLSDYALDDPPTSDNETCSPHGSDNEAPAPAPRRVPPVAPEHKAANFGARQECRIDLTRFRNMNFDTVDGDGDGDGSALSPMLTRVNDHPRPHRRRVPHFPYWILPTTEVLQFIAATTNRWLLHLEVIMTRLEGGVRDLTPMTWKDEQMHGVMVMAIVRTLALSFGGDDPRMFPHRPLWRDDWTMSRLQHDNHEDDGTPTVRLGLGYRRSVDTYGMVWVRADLIRWLPLPYFSQYALKNLGLSQDNNAFQKSFRRPQIANLLNKEHYFYRRWRKHCKTHITVRRAYEPVERWVKRTLDLAAQLVVKEYNLEVFDILAKRCYIAKKDWKAAVQSRNTGPCPLQDEWPSKAEQKEHFLAQMDEDSRNGFCMLTPGLVTRITGARPHIIHAKAPGSNGKGAVFAPYHRSGLWEDRVRALFGFDEPELEGRRRKWERCKFRTLVKQLWTIFDQTFEHILRQPDWTYCLGRHASKLMLIIPQYDADHLSCIQKAKDGNAVETRQKINGTPMVQRTNWLSCRLEEEHHEFVHRVDRAVNDEPTQKAIRDILRDSPLQTLTNTNSRAAKYPRGVFHNLDLDGLDDTFYEAEMHHILAEEDSREDAGEVESEPEEGIRDDSSSSDE